MVSARRIYCDELAPCPPYTFCAKLNLPDQSVHCTKPTLPDQLAPVRLGLYCSSRARRVGLGGWHSIRTIAHCAIQLVLSSEDLETQLSQTLWTGLRPLFALQILFLAVSSLSQCELHSNSRSYRSSSIGCSSSEIFPLLFFNARFRKYFGHYRKLGPSKVAIAPNQPRRTCGICRRDNN